MIRFKTILHPTDFSEPAGHAFRLACSLARDHGARLILLHVQEPIVPVAGAIGPAAPDLTAEREALRQRLEAMRPDEPLIAVTHTLVTGDAADAILCAAADNKCDLIVMGTHGRTGLGRLLIGSVSEGVMHKARCPVVTVKHPVPEAEAPPEPQVRVSVTVG